jgi:hypothetical protein
LKLLGSARLRSVSLGFARLCSASLGFGLAWLGLAWQINKQKNLYLKENGAAHAQDEGERKLVLRVRLP